MAAVRAERLCPDAVFVAPDLARYRAVSRLTHSPGCCSMIIRRSEHLTSLEVSHWFEALKRSQTDLLMYT